MKWEIIWIVVLATLCVSFAEPDNQSSPRCGANPNHGESSSKCEEDKRSTSSDLNKNSNNNLPNERQKKSSDLNQDANHSVKSFHFPKEQKDSGFSETNQNQEHRSKTNHNSLSNFRNDQEPFKNDRESGRKENIPDERSSGKYQGDKYPTGRNEQVGKNMNQYNEKPSVGDAQPKEAVGPERQFISNKPSNFNANPISNEKVPSYINNYSENIPTKTPQDSYNKEKKSQRPPVHMSKGTMTRSPSYQPRDSRDSPPRYNAKNSKTHSPNDSKVGSLTQDETFKKTSDSMKSPNQQQNFPKYSPRESAEQHKSSNSPQSSQLSEPRKDLSEDYMKNNPGNQQPSFKYSPREPMEDMKSSNLPHNCNVLAPSTGRNVDHMVRTPSHQQPSSEYSQREPIECNNSPHSSHLLSSRKGINEDYINSSPAQQQPSLKYSPREQVEGLKSPNDPQGSHLSPSTKRNGDYTEKTPPQQQFPSKYSPREPMEHLKSFSSQHNSNPTETRKTHNEDLRKNVPLHQQPSSKYSPRHPTEYSPSNTQQNSNSLAPRTESNEVYMKNTPSQQQPSSKNVQREDKKHFKSLSLPQDSHSSGPRKDVDEDYMKKAHSEQLPSSKYSPRQPVEHLPSNPSHTSHSLPSNKENNEDYMKHTPSQLQPSSKYLPRDSTEHLKPNLLQSSSSIPLKKEFSDGFMKNTPSKQQYSPREQTEHLKSSILPHTSHPSASRKDRNEDYLKTAHLQQISSSKHSPRDLKEHLKPSSSPQNHNLLASGREPNRDYTNQPQSLRTQNPNEPSSALERKVSQDYYSQSPSKTSLREITRAGNEELPLYNEVKPKLKPFVNNQRDIGEQSPSSFSQRDRIQTNKISNYPDESLSYDPRPNIKEPITRPISDSLEKNIPPYTNEESYYSQKETLDVKKKIEEPIISPLQSSIPKRSFEPSSNMYTKPGGNESPYFGSRNVSPAVSKADEDFKVSSYNIERYGTNLSKPTSKYSLPSSIDQANAGEENQEVLENPPMKQATPYSGLRYTEQVTSPTEKTPNQIPYSYPKPNTLKGATFNDDIDSDSMVSQYSPKQKKHGSSGSDKNLKILMPPNAKSTDDDSSDIPSTNKLSDSVKRYSPSEDETSSESLKSDSPYSAPKPKTPPNYMNKKQPPKRILPDDNTDSDEETSSDVGSRYNHNRNSQRHPSSDPDRRNKNRSNGRKSSSQSSSSRNRKQSKQRPSARRTQEDSDSSESDQNTNMMRTQMRRNPHSTGSMPQRPPHSMSSDNAMQRPSSFPPSEHPRHRSPNQDYSRFPSNQQPDRPNRRNSESNRNDARSNYMARERFQQQNGYPGSDSQNQGPNYGPRNNNRQSNYDNERLSHQNRDQHKRPYDPESYKRHSAGYSPKSERQSYPRHESPNNKSPTSEYSHRDQQTPSYFSPNAERPPRTGTPRDAPERYPNPNFENPSRYMPRDYSQVQPGSNFERPNYNSYIPRQAQMQQARPQQYGEQPDYSHRRQMQRPYYNAE